MTTVRISAGGRARTLCHSLAATVVAGSTALGACTGTAQRETDVSTINGPSGSDTGGEPSVPGTASSLDSNPLPTLTPSASEANTPSSGGAGGNAESASSSGGGGAGAADPSLDGGGSGMNSVPLGGNGGTEVNETTGGLHDAAVDGPVGSDAGPRPSALCPASLEEAFPYLSPATCPVPGLQCDVPVGCNSGPVVLTLTCVDTEWDGASDCDKPFDYCPETLPTSDVITPGLYCVDGQWRVEDYLRGLADGLAGCPKELPVDGGDCRALGGTGGVDRESCGYPCPSDPSKWTVLTCVDPQNYLPSTWVSDGACD